MSRVRIPSAAFSSNNPRQSSWRGFFSVLIDALKQYGLEIKSDYTFWVVSSWTDETHIGAENDAGLRGGNPDAKRNKVKEGHCP